MTVPRLSSNIFTTLVFSPSPSLRGNCLQYDTEGRPHADLDVDDVERGAIEPLVLQHVVQQLSNNGSSLVRGSIPSGRPREPGSARIQIDDRSTNSQHREHMSWMYVARSVDGLDRTVVISNSIFEFQN